MNKRKRKRQRTKKKERKRVSEHKSGDHVFNKGVKTIYYDIITAYLKEHGITHCRDDMTQTRTPKLYNIFHEDNKNWPLDKAIVSLIDEMAVPSGKKDKPDDNSVLFGEGKKCVVQGVVSLLNRVIYIIKSGDDAVLTPDNEKDIEKLREDLKDDLKKYYTHEGDDSCGEDGFYVDPKAKERWMKENEGNEQLFAQCIGAVREIFHNLVDAKDNDPKQWLIYNWAKEILLLDI